MTINKHDSELFDFIKQNLYVIEINFTLTI